MTMDHALPESHMVPAADGTMISFHHYRAADRAAALIVCPGFFQTKEAGTFRRISQALAQGWDVVTMDFRGHGRSGGLYTFSAREGADLEAVLDWTAARYPRIGLLGFSMGGAIAINTAARRPGRVASLAAVSAPADFDRVEFKFWTPEAMRTGLQGCERGVGCRPHPQGLWLPKERPLDTVKALAEVPKLFLHGTRDVIVGDHHSRRLFEAAPDPKRLAIVPGGSHAQALFRDDSAHFLSIVRNWFADTLA